MKKVLSIVMLLLLIFSGIGCSQTPVPAPSSPEIQSFESVLIKAKGTTVNFYGWGGDERINRWIDTQLAPHVKENYEITLKRVPMDIDQILNKLLGEKQADKSKGSIDMVWINGENFYTAMKNQLIYGPFTQELPNYQKYIDPDSKEVQYDFGYEIKGYEAPYGKAQFVLINDSAITSETPKDTQELLGFAKQYKGKVTYPAPPDFTGSAFVRNIIYDIVGYENVVGIGNDKEKLKAAIQPAMDYLKELSPYLWQEGKTYPSSIAQVDNMFADGELVMTMSYNPNSVAGMIETGQFKETARSFIFDKGMIGNTHYLAIPANASNLEGALVVINAILSPEIQASKYDPKNWGDLPVLDNAKLNSQEKELFSKIPLGKGVIPQDRLLSKRLPELPADLIPVIEEVWQSQIPGNK
ncbi:ABC transporter substrate-binding protein [Desulfosporosinus youngiae]|uniref:ABC-type uncharacterized transport system, periplasmic component n=1 Tax=Desulfosporosinus youngiae DSM 17734 TaxID=768710 RepID=H5XV91_9FIRM|nr:ABC transporter substrate-binding protein [Desulfosporosinus youngiae]EHQ89689.1 ABC-type uncharacterized transport system, periplasmic component [Desulfosporosinus youngiae DSM 17734]